VDRPPALRLRARPLCLANVTVAGGGHRSRPRARELAVTEQ
jgi:hypothetical protein